VEQARRLWRAAHGRHGAPDRLRLCTDASANHRRTAIAVADQWRAALGVEVELVEIEWKAYLALRENPGDCDLLRFGWSADFIDAEAFLALFESGHAQNVPGYASARYDALMAESRLARDAAQRTESMVRAEQMLLADSPVIPVFHRVSKLLAKPDVAGVAVSPLGHLATRHLRFKTKK
jgi:oligopeptide transport system substrate-binding protein